MSIRIIIGDALERLRELPDESVHCVVTSPPYWGLRAYGGNAGMIGLEPTFDDHLANLVAVFREVRRVLRSDGTLWLNYGDAYAASGGMTGRNENGQATWSGGVCESGPKVARPKSGFKPKDLMMMPARVAMALQADGWWVRSEIVWHKPNPMPESVQDRPTIAHEKVFLLSKCAKYFYDAEAVRVPPTREWWSENTVSPKNPDRNDGGSLTKNREAAPTSGANLRNVWSIATHAFPGAHFATFPLALVEPCIKAGTSAKGVCGECGAPWVRECEITRHAGHKARVDELRHKGGSGEHASSTRVFKGWQPTCQHDDEVRPAIVLDPFAGSGTVGLVADRLGRDAILIELNSEYAAMAEQRIAGENPLFCKVEVEG